MAKLDKAGIGGGLFDKSADIDKLKSFDAYIDDAKARKKMDDAKKSGKKSKLKDKDGNLDVDKTDDCKKPLLQSEKVEYEKSGFLKATEKMKSKVDEFANSCAYKNTKAAIKGMAQRKSQPKLSKNRFKSALTILSAALPVQLSKSCQNIIDNFASKVAPKHNGYDKIGINGTKYIESDQVQCALDALEMLSGIKGLKGKITNTLVDIEATAVVLAGMITTLVDYDMVEDIEAVIGTNKSTKAMKRAVGLSSAVIISSGNLQLINWMIDKIGVSGAKEYNNDLIGDVVGNYQRRPEDTDTSLINTLERIDPNWDKNGEIYYFDVITDGSPDAQEVFYIHAPFRALDTVRDVTYFNVVGNRLPTISEITRSLYPNATGAGLAPTMSTSNDMYFYI